MKKVLAFLAVMMPAIVLAAPSVSFVETVDTEFNRYKVSAAKGSDQVVAKKEAARAATLFAALQLTGDDTEKSRLESTKATWLDMADEVGRVGRVLKVMWEGDDAVIDVIVDVNVKTLRRKLEAKALIAKATDVADALGNPTILIMPEGSDGRKVNPAESFIVDRIASFFTQKKYDLVDKGAIENVTNMTKAMEAIDGVFDDPIAEVAALTGADIYITYKAGITANVKASASIKAFETTTGRLLAAATGESRHYPAGYAHMDAIREAVSDGIPKIFEDISGYWAEDMKKGKKYMITISGDFSDRDAYKAVVKGVKKMGKMKWNVKTKQKLSGVLRTTGDSDDIEFDLEDIIKDAGFDNPSLVANTRGTLIFRAE